MTASSYNNGISESRAYNTDNTLASISFTGAAIGDLSYGWDENKNKTSETIGGTMSGYGFSVGSSGYDDEDRLVNWERTDTNLDQSWNLSPVGNWNSFTENATTQVRTHSPANEILTAATEDVFHDPKGNTTLIPPVLRPTSSGLPPTASRLTWDFDNKLRAADTNDDNTDDIFYKWDALGRRVGRDDGTSNVIYFQDGQQTLADYPAGTSSASPTYKYVFASYIDEIVARIDSSDDILYYHRNQQYSITAVSDDGGSVVERYAYSAYGQVTIAEASGSQISDSAISNRYTYTGREWDEGLSLYHYRARMYDAVGGRFVSRDPMKYIDGVSLYQPYFVPSQLDWSGLARTKTDAECCAQYSKDHDGNVKGGMVICCQGDYVPCVFFKPGGSTKGDDILHDCGIEHEKDHIADLRPCLKVRLKTQCYRPDFKYPPQTNDEEEERDFRNKQECKAYAVELKCLQNNIAKCERDSECLRQVRKRITQIEVAIMKNERNCDQYNGTK